MFTLRPYQRESVTAVIRHFRRTDAPAVVVLPTGAGKSLVIAELARLARGRVLVLAHVKELVEQNHGKYEAWGLQGSVFSAGLKRKEAEHQVVFGSVQSVARNLEYFEQGFTLLVIDECHRLSDDKDSEYQRVISHLRRFNPGLKILGLTATPYRLGSGWIYRYHHHGIVRGGEDCFFRDCIFELPLRLMVRQGYLTSPRMLDGAIAQYDFSMLRPTSGGAFSAADLNQVVRRSERATARIIEQVRQHAAKSRGVMIFAATVEHAREISGYLEGESAALIVGETVASERDRLIEEFKQQRIRYLINVAVLTTGFDAPHVDLIAILRPTESVSLYQQIVGRGLRLSPGKTECLVLDYAGNQYDVFAPEVGCPPPHSDSQPVMVFCPKCEFANTFWGKLDSDGQLIEHYGRGCQGVVESAAGRAQCDFRFRFKECDLCGGENDIAARRCGHCGGIIIDPDTRLRDALALRDALVIRCAGMTFQRSDSRDGMPMLKVTYHDEDGEELSEHFRLDTASQRRAFQVRFVRLHLRSPEAKFTAESVDQVVASEACFRSPDFVIARKKGPFWNIREKLFDYEGRYRQANQLG